jgi:mono/diheme cytochrome c family protein
MCLSMLLCCGVLSLAERLVCAEENVVSQRDTTEQNFAREVWPLLSEKCLACHGSDSEKIRGGLDLTTSAGAKRGGESGEAAIVSGKPQLSPLFLSVTRSHAEWSAMPPKDNDALTTAQVETLQRRGSTAAPRFVSACSGGQSTSADKPGA